MKEEELGENLGDDVKAGDDTPMDMVKDAPKAAPRKRTVKSKMTKILLEENDDIPPTGLYVGHNGRGYLVKAGVPVDVPPHVLEILDNAKMSSPVLDPGTKQIVGYRERLRYPYRRVS